MNLSNPFLETTCKCRICAKRSIVEKTHRQRLLHFYFTKISPALCKNKSEREREWRNKESSL